MAVFKAFFLWVMRMFRNAVNVVFTFIALLILLFVGASVWGMLSDKGLPPAIVLTLDLRGGMTDQPTFPPFGIGSVPAAMTDLVQGLERAEGDPRVKGIVIRVGGGVSFAHAQELRAALASFRAQEKFVITHSQAFYTTALSEYYLATTADQIWLQPASMLNSAGIVTSTVFLRGLFDLVGAEVYFAQRYEYKNAANVYTETDFTDAHREATGGLINSIYESLMGDMAAARNMTPEAFKALINAGPYTTETALQARLIDFPGYDDDAERAALDRAGADSDTVDFFAYYARERSPYEAPMAGATVIALVSGEGGINDGYSGSDFSGDMVMGGDTIAQAIRDATADEEVRAIVFRVSSPGGSAIASDQVLDAVRKARGAGKPVIVSMGPVAASGGYYVSLDADWIFAQPATITGSIGVLSGKINLTGAYNMIGLSPRTLSVGENADAMSEFTGFTPEQWEMFNKQVDNIYWDFTQKVADGRSIPVDRVRWEIGKGRVWSGADALRLGLIDEFGGLRAAIAKARDMSGGAADQPVRLKIYPEPMSAWQQIVSASVSVESGFMKLARIADALDMRSVRDMLAAMEAADEPVLMETRMPEMELR